MNILEFGCNENEIVEILKKSKIPGIRIYNCEILYNVY